jgi:hypothetical protein
MIQSQGASLKRARPLILDQRMLVVASNMASEEEHHWRLPQWSETDRRAANATGHKRPIDFA